MKDLPRAARCKELLRDARQPEPRSIVRLADQVEQDYQFRLGYLVIESLVRSASVELTIDADPDSGDRATTIRENILKQWSTILPAAMRAFAYGRAAFEKTFRYDPASKSYLIAGLDYLPPDRTELVLGKEGEFAGIELTGVEGRTHLEVERSWWFALDPTATEPHGRSRYLGAPLAIWRARRQLEEQERIWYSKFAIGHGIARAPDSSNVSNDPSSDPMEVMRQELARIESGGILILSSRTGSDGKYLYDYQASDGQQASGPLERRREMLDVAALRSLGVPERAITQNDRSGSRAMAQVHLEVLYRTCEGVLDQILSSFSRYVVRKVIEFNWPADRLPRWTMTYRPIGDSSAISEEESLRNLARDLVMSSTMPELVRRDVIDLDRLLRLARLPIARPWSQTPHQAPLNASPWNLPTSLPSTGIRKESAGAGVGRLDSKQGAG